MKDIEDMNESETSVLDSPATSVPSWTGVVRFLHTTPRAFLPMRAMPSLQLVAGKGITGDRYEIGNESGFYSDKPEEGRQVTLFEIEVLQALKRDYAIDFAPDEHRRNMTVEGVPLNSLVGKRFWVGETLLESTRLSVPCKHIEEVTGKEVFNALVHRSGLNCKILTGGTVRVGDMLRPA